MVGLDGADGTRLDRWSADGSLPNLAKLREGGVAKAMSAPVGVTDDGLWASFQYGCGLGEHGRYHYLQRNAGGAFDMAFRAETRRPRFWDALSDAGRRVAVLDVPKCAPPRPINGVHLADWMVHGRYFDAPLSYPEPLAAEVVARFGAAPRSLCDHAVPCPGDAEAHELIANLRTSLERKRAAALHLLSTEPWDLFLVAFKEAHCAGHAFWELADDSASEAGAARNLRLGDPYRAVLKQLDAVIGDLVEAAGSDASVVVFCTTEMEANGTIEHLLPQIVSRMNRRLGDTLFAKAARRVRARLMRTSAPPPCELLPYTENCAAFRLNGDLARLGAVVESLIRGLVDVETGRPVTASVDRPSAQLAGPLAGALPDLLVRISSGLAPSAVVSPILGRIEADPPPMRPGNHALGGGMVFLTGAADASADTVTAIEDLGPLAQRLLE
jgi:hypothetical protein